MLKLPALCSYWPNQMDKVIVFVKSGPATPRGGRLRGHGPPLLGNKGKKEIVLNQKLLKGCHQAQNITVLAILERLEIKTFPLGQPCMVSIFSMFHDPVNPHCEEICVSKSGSGNRLSG